MKIANVAEQLNAIQHMLVPSEMSDTLRENTRSYWENQDKILEATQAFADGWFKRRHAGTHAALEAAQRMCKAESPVDVVREYQDWASGALLRVLADGLACQKQGMAMISAVAPRLVPLGSETPADSSRTEPKMQSRSKAA